MYIFWAIAGIILIFSDMLKKSKMKLVFACACLFCAITAYKYTDNIIYQTGAFFSFLGIFYFLIKAIFQKEKNDIKLNNELKDYIGQIAVVKKDIGKTLSIDGIGIIEYKNHNWSAKSIDDKEIKAGRKVKIVSKENMIMNVEALN